MAGWMKWFPQSVVLLALSVASWTSPPIAPANATDSSPAEVTENESSTLDSAALNTARLYAGTYVFVGGEKQKQRVTQAIEDVVQQLNVLIRPIARDRLGPPNAIPHRIHVSANEDFTTITLDQRTIRAQVNGKQPVNATDVYGKPVQFWHKLQQGHLIEHAVGKGGTKKNVFILSEDGKKLIIDVTMDSKQLPAPIKYRLTYRRAP